MQQRKLNVGFVRFPYSGNGSCSSEHPDIADWLVTTVLAIKQDPRIENVFQERFSDTPICMTRNASIKWAKEAGVDVLVMVDSDQAPDMYLGHRKEAKPFFKTSFDFLYENFDKQISIIVAPYCGPPSHPINGGMENVYVFRWANYNTGHMEWPVKLDGYSCAEASLMEGISNVDAGPTGLCMIDMRAFEHLSHPYFDYEWEGDNEQCPHCHQRIPGPRTAKASTEDVFFFRNISLNMTVKFGYNPVFCNWDAWAGHWKPWCVGKPSIVRSDEVGRQLRHAIETSPPSGVTLRQFGKKTNRDIRDYTFARPLPNGMPDPTDMDAGWKDEVEARKKASDLPSQFDSASWAITPQGNGTAAVAEPIAMNLHATRLVADEPDETDLGHKTCQQDLDNLATIVNRYCTEHFVEDHPLTIVELGSWVGKSALAMAAAVPETMECWIHCVDMFSLPAAPHEWMTGPMFTECQKRIKAGDYDPIWKQFLKNVANNRGHIVGHRAETVALGRVWEKPIDILFVDADHSYESVLADLKAWMPHMRDTGIIIGDDYTKFDGVRKAVNEVFNGDQLTMGNLFYWYAHGNVEEEMKMCVDGVVRHESDCQETTPGNFIPLPSRR